MLFTLWWFLSISVMIKLTIELLVYPHFLTKNNDILIGYYIYAFAYDILFVLLLGFWT